MNYSYIHCTFLLTLFKTFKMLFYPSSMSAQNYDLSLQNVNVLICLQNKMKNTQTYFDGCLLSDK